MTTTNANNPSHLTPPPALSLANAGDMRADALVTIFFRQSSGDGNFTVTPVQMHPADATRAVNGFPYEYSTSGSTWATWPGAYNNSAQKTGARGRLLGASVAAD